jgi:hypothetical protein
VTVNLVKTSIALNGKGAFFYFEPVTVDASNPLLDRPPAGIPGDLRREIRITTQPKIWVVSWLRMMALYVFF